MAAQRVSSWSTVLLTIVVFFISCCFVEAKFINLCPGVLSITDEVLNISNIPKKILSLTGNLPVVVKSGESIIHLDPNSYYWIKPRRHELESGNGTLISELEEDIQLTHGDVAVSCKNSKKSREDLEAAFQRQSTIIISTPTSMFSDTTEATQTSTSLSDRHGKSLEDRTTEEVSENSDPTYGAGHTTNYHDFDMQTTIVPTSSLILRTFTTPIPLHRQNTPALAQTSTKMITNRPVESTAIDSDQSSEVANSLPSITSSAASMVNNFSTLPEISIVGSRYKENETTSLQTTIGKTSTFPSSIVEYNTTTQTKVTIAETSALPSSIVEHDSTTQTTEVTIVETSALPSSIVEHDSSSQTTKVSSQDENHSAHSSSPVPSTFPPRSQSPTQTEPSIAVISPFLRSGSTTSDSLEPKTYSLYVIIGIVLFLVTLLIIATACIVQRKRNSAKRRLTGTNEDFFISNFHNEACLLNADSNIGKKNKENSNGIGMYSEIELEVISPQSLQDKVLASSAGNEREAEKPRCLSSMDGMGI